MNELAKDDKSKWMMMMVMGMGLKVDIVERSNEDEVFIVKKGI
jgi:hypothetical protein